MSTAASLAAHILRELRRTIAQTVCSRLEADGPFGGAAAARPTIRQMVDQAESHIQTLAACLKFSCPGVLSDHLHWADELREHVAPRLGGVPRFMDETLSVLEPLLPRRIYPVVTEFVEQALNWPREPLPAKPAPAGRAEDLRRDYLAALLQKRREDAAGLVLEAVNAGLSIETIYLDVIQPTMHELGRRWQQGEISVAEEHYCTAATQFVMSQLQPYFLKPSYARQTLVATCVGDELHEVGLRIVADLFEVGGWNAIYLGADAPPESVADTLATTGAPVLAASTTLARHLFGVEELIQCVRSTPGLADVKVLVGGYPFNRDAYLWTRVGADAAAADARTALQVANRWVESGSVAAVSAPTSPSAMPAEVERLTAGVEELPPGERHDELSRLNNRLITMQRELSKANLELAAMNEANEAQNEALKRADRRKDQFLAMLAHELRGPLAPMVLAVSLLQMEDLDQQAAAEARGTLKRQLQHMKYLIGELLDASRITHGKIQLKKELVDLTDVVRRAVDIAQPLFDQKHQDLRIDLASAITLDGDEIRLAQVFANLLTNASKYTDLHGTIWLTSKRVRDEAVVEVRDNGVGIAPDLLSDVFSAFAQEERSRKHSMGGLGLGLSLVKQLVELHGGSVNVQSEGADKGSTFTVRLPAHAPADAPEGQGFDEVELPPGPTIPRKVLVVEDTAGIARMTALLFRVLGHVPSIAHDGAAAVRIYRAGSPDIVVLDLVLPDMSGLEVAEKIRQLDDADATLIVALTGHDDDEHRRLAREHGCDEYLVKPVGVEELGKLASHPKLAAVEDLS